MMPEIFCLDIRIICFSTMDDKLPFDYGQAREISYFILVLLSVVFFFVRYDLQTKPMIGTSEPKCVE